MAQSACRHRQARQNHHFISWFSDISAQKARENDLRRIGYEDPLTGLPNRRRLHDLMASRLRHLRAGESLDMALIDIDGRVLVVKRPPGKPMAGLWEFPGGKVEKGERPEQALIRELKEEISIDVTANCLAPLTFASHSYEDFHLLMPLYVCRKWDGQIVLNEATDSKWLKPNEIRNLDTPEADVPLIAMLRDMI